MLLRRDADQERNEHIDMTPMVDVVFQLMTFMLFSVQMSGGEKVDIPPARHGIGVEESAATFLTLTKPDASTGETRLLLGHGSGPEISLDEARKAVADGSQSAAPQGDHSSRPGRAARRGAESRRCGRQSRGDHGPSRRSGIARSRVT